MKKDSFQALNFVAFNLLFFALYLNFIHKENNSLPPVPPTAPPSALTSTVTVQNPDQYLKGSVESTISQTSAETRIAENSTKPAFN